MIFIFFKIPMKYTISGAYFLYKTNRKESKLKFQKQAVLFIVRNIHFFHVVAVVFGCGYYFVDVGVVVADYFGQTRSRDDRTFSRQPLFLRRHSRSSRTCRISCQRAKIFFSY